MERIFNYIARGKGWGIRWLLLFTLVVTVVYAAGIRSVGNRTFVPAAQKVADHFLPIRVEEGIVVEPADTVKNYTLVLGDENDADAETIEFVMNTGVDSLDTEGLNNGLYLTRKAIYTVTGNKTEIRELEDSFYLPQGDYTEVFKSLLNWVVVSFSVFGYVILFAFYLLAVMFYACCSYAVSALMKKKFEFDLRMRLSVLAFVATYAVFSLLGLFGFSSRIIFFIAVLALQGLILKDMAAEQPEAKSE